jgi:hypothetical protein
MPIGFTIPFGLIISVFLGGFEVASEPWLSVYELSPTTTICPKSDKKQIFITLLLRWRNGCPAI